MKCILDEFKCETLNDGGDVEKILNLITVYYDKKFAEYPTLFKLYNNSQFQDELFEFWKKKKKLICPWYTWDDCCERVVKTNICSHIITDLLSALFSYWCGTHGRIVVKE